MKKKYLEISNKLDTLGIAYQRLRSCNKVVSHTPVECLLVDSIMQVLIKYSSIESLVFHEIFDTLGKLYQRVSSVNSGKIIGGTGYHQKVLVSIEDILKDQF